MGASNIAASLAAQKMLMSIWPSRPSLLVIALFIRMGKPCLVQPDACFLLIFMVKYCYHSRKYGIFQHGVFF